MKENLSNIRNVTPMLFPYEPAEFWQQLRQIIKEEVNRLDRPQSALPSFETPGLKFKPLYKIAEVCSLFHVTKPTIYEWIKHGKLKPHKIRSRVYFLWQDIQQLLTPAQE